MQPNPQRGAETGEAVLAVDVGGTDTKSALGIGGAELLDVRRAPTDRPVGAGPDAAGDAVVAQVTRLLAEHRAARPRTRIGAIGLIAPGLVDEAAGVGIYSANLGWSGYPFAERVAAATGLPVTFGHDVGAAGEAEFRLGAARGYADVVVTIIGTGVAAAIFCDGRRVTGGGYAGELGHASVPGGADCPCGASGCLETVGSAGAISRRYARSCGREVDGAREVFALAAAGDRLAAAVVDDAVRGLAYGLSHVVSVLAPEAIVIGGGLSAAGEQLRAPLQRSLDSLLSIHRRPRLLFAELGPDAGLIGAGLRAGDLLTGSGR
ncbi:sugar kinase [Kocuria polaris]|nr:sugar kinase [Kocuria polaris]